MTTYPPAGDAARRALRWKTRQREKQRNQLDYAGQWRPRWTTPRSGQADDAVLGDLLATARLRVHLNQECVARAGSGERRVQPVDLRPTWL